MFPLDLRAILTPTKRFGFQAHICDLLADHLERPGSRIEVIGGMVKSQPPARTVVGPGRIEFKR